jgi:uroporphyrinogen decarboxylase
MRSMTPRERWRAVLAGREPDRPPSDFWGTAETIARLLRDLECASERELWQRLGVDKCIYLGPRNRRTGEDSWHTPSHWKAWHIGVRNVQYGDGLGAYEETVFHPLAAAENVADIERFDWPDPQDWDTAGLAAALDAWPDYPRLAGCYEPFYLYCHLRGMEQAFRDLLESPAIAEAALERIYSIHESLIARILAEAGDRIDLVYIAEDLGTQESLLMSPVLFRRFLKPRMRRIIEKIHAHGVKVLHHDDGAIRPVIPDLIEAGIDLLNPIQWRCRGMDREALARDFGRELVFHGGIDNQHTLPFGTAQEVRCQVRDNIRIFRQCRGYIVAPCHNLQPNTPTDNIVALYEAVRE